MEPLFPLWKSPTDALASAMIRAGLRARITCVDSWQLPASFAGREFDAYLLRDLPAGVDLCGERGEFHTCVYVGPMFNAPLAIENGEIVDRDGFVYADIECGRAPSHPRTKSQWRWAHATELRPPNVVERTMKT